MTIVAAMKFADRICVMSDTMITDEGSARNNIIPGRLKSIVINRWLTVSYAGLSTQAIDSVRLLHKAKNISTNLALEHLAQVSFDHYGALDFILCSHETTPRIVKISNGQVFEGADAYWIGSSKAANELSKVEIPHMEYENLPEYMGAEELIFKGVFND